MDEVRIIKVVWVDPHSVDEWSSDEDVAESELCKIISVGIFVKETKDKLVMTLNWDLQGGETSCAMILPKSCILHMTEIAWVKRPYEA